VRLATVAAAGGEVPVAIVEERAVDARASTVACVAEDGRVLEVRVGDGVVARAEPELVAKRLDRVDLIGVTRVKLPGPLPRSVPATIRYRVRGLPPAFAAFDPRQEVLPAGPGEVLLTVSARHPRAADPAIDAARGQAPSARGDLLAPTPEMDSDDPAIRALSREIVAGERGVYAAARRINDAVFRRLEKAHLTSRVRASEVLATGRGDSTEHTLLFVALARAAGVPARAVHGLVYRSDGGVHALYWQAWPEVLSGGEWIALDPTLGQPVADATHIALGTGMANDTVALLGAIEVLSAEPLP
jgi:transglutaminase-like putative cysteine protease